MDLLAVILVGIALAMDAFAVSLCKGLAIGKVRAKAMIIIGVWFGFFQFLMPVIGFYVGRSFYDLISEFDHWIAFLLLAIIGANMIREALSSEEEDNDPDIGFKIMLLLAIATSIDALAVGISLAMEGGNIWYEASVIGILTFAISAVGVKIGSLFGNRFGNKAELLGGVILIIIGVKILLEHLGVF